MQEVRHGNADGVDIRPGQNVFVICGVLRDFVLLAELDAARNIESSECDDIGALVEQVGLGVKIADAATDDADSQIVGHTRSRIPFQTRDVAGSGRSGQLRSICSGDVQCLTRVIGGMQWRVVPFLSRLAVSVISVTSGGQLNRAGGR